MQNSAESKHEFRVGQRVHTHGDSHRTGTVRYVGPVEGYSGTWVGVDWDNGEGKHNGSINGVRYFQAKSERSGSFVRAQNLSQGISLLEALEKRYRSDSTKDEEDEMYVLSTSNKRVSIQLLGKDKIHDMLSRLEELTSASLSCLGVSSPGIPCHINTRVPNIKELDLTWNLLSEWKDIVTICEQLPNLGTLNLTSNLMSPCKSELPLLKSICVLVLNNSSVDWEQVELLKQSITAIEELHLMGNSISRILPMSSSMVLGFDSLRLLNLEDNCIAEWDEIVKLSQLRCLEQLYLNKNSLNSLFYPDKSSQYEPEVACYKPFQNLSCLLLGDNNFGDLVSVDSLNFFPKLVACTNENKETVADTQLIAALYIREQYVRLVISRLHTNPEEVKQHPRFSELKKIHGIEDERPSVGPAGPRTTGSGFLSITLECVGASMGFSIAITAFDNDMSSLMDLGIGNGSTILVDEES
ncbi:hypothetical protein TanjilG_17894 [Lupinus angustifolius]|uniref:CAP-Gly domain-containing protein n=1 Tax=Lupinus angustifolius TaxID=3871 RepID=A0A4P1QQ35_LUPAN|nr:hypothetical protein TanjilG_17894 [Lupinus angustifolius]